MHAYIIDYWLLLTIDLALYRCGTKSNRFESILFSRFGGNRSLELQTDCFYKLNNNRLNQKTYAEGSLYHSCQENDRYLFCLITSRDGNHHNVAGRNKKDMLFSNENVENPIKGVFLREPMEHLRWVCNYFLLCLP